MRNNSLLHGVIAVIIFGTLPVTIRYIDIEPFTLGIFRLILGVLLCLPIVIKRRLNYGKRHFGVLVLIGLCFGLHWITYFYSIKISTASIGAIGVCTFGVHLLILGALFLSIKFTPIDFFAVLVATFGCLILVPEFSFFNHHTMGLVLSVISGFLYALLPVLHKKVAFIPTFTRTYYQFLFALIVFVPFFSKTDWNLDAVDWVGMVYLGTVCTIVAHSLWVRATTELSPVASSIIYYGYLPIALILNNLILGEKFTSKDFLGIFMILAGNILAFTRGSALKISNRSRLPDSSLE